MLSLTSKNLISVLQKQAIRLANKPAFLLLENGQNKTAEITYRQLDQKARTVAAYLQSKHLFAQPVLLLFSNSLDFITAFIGCLYAGVIAVPVNILHHEEIKKLYQVIDTIYAQVNAAGILTTQLYISELRNSHLPLCMRDEFLLVDTTSLISDIAINYQVPEISASTVAYLQYSSGSTTSLKAASVNYESLMYSLKNTAKAWRYSADSITLTWAPYSHVYGLVCGLLLPLYTGTLAISIPPYVLVKRPACWLEAITKYRVTHSGCPNFGYDLCIQEIHAAEVKHFNLRSWKVAANGGETIQYETLKNFSQKFSACGFSINNFFLVYGMTEMIGVIATAPYKNRVRKRLVTTDASHLIGSGYLLPGLQAKIVDPDTLVPVTEGKIGEIWLTGKSLASGYWNNPEETKAAFYARFPKAKHYHTFHERVLGFFQRKVYFRTGDLGFIHKKEIFITGRMKELIVVYGKKYYPADLEMTAVNALKDLPVGQHGVAFSVPVDGKEEVVMVQEIKDETSPQTEIIKTIRDAILQRYNIHLSHIVLVKNHSIPKTASGKLQRKLCQQQFLEQKLAVVKQFLQFASCKLPFGSQLIQNSAPAEFLPFDNSTRTDNSANDETKTRLAQPFHADLIKIISSVLNIDEHQINLNTHLSEYPLDSIKIIQLTTKLNDTYQVSITPANLFNYSTFSELFNDWLDKHQEALKAYYLAFFSVDETGTDSNTSPHQINTGFSVGEQDFRNVAAMDGISSEHRKCVSENPVPPRKSQHQQPIAIIGINSTFPAAPDPDTFWHNLITGKDAITEIPKERWDWKAYLDQSAATAHKTTLKWGGFVDDMMFFDADFFNLSPREAELMDPQQRLFLQVVWRTIEDAGYTKASLGKIRTGLFVGVFGNDYAERLQQNGIVDPYMTTGITHSILANRVSYLFNFHGPSIAIDTACSSSLVAIHQAVLAIQTGDCEVAIAGGVNALLSPTNYLLASQAGMLSEEGKCKTFDQQADGYVRGEGAAAILLKPLSKAKADGNHIYGVIKGTAVNHGGQVNSLTVPNPQAQAEVIVAACHRAGISADTIRYIETHGTGTSLGDPIEIEGLKTAFSLLNKEQDKESFAKNYCGLGAVKTHIGHLESAAGMAGMIKVLLMLQHRQIPANLHFQTLNPYIDLANSAFYMVDKPEDFNRLTDKENNSIPLRVGISSFGFGGTNAHVVVEESPLPQSIGLSASIPYLIVLSAKTEGTLQKKISDLYNWLNTRQSHELSLAAISYTLNVGREHFSKRGALVVQSVEALQQTLHQVLQQQVTDNFMISTGDEVRLKNQPIFKQLFQQVFKQLNGAEKLSSDEFYDKLLALGNFYVEGYEVNWEQLLVYPTKQHISLPTYPFAKAYYGLPVAPVNPQQSFQPDNTDPVKINQPGKHEPTKQKKQDKIFSTVEIVQQNFKQIISTLLKKPLHAIDIKASLNELGLDSISLKELTLALANSYGIKLNPSLFFTYQTIDALSRYLLNTYPELQKIPPTHHQINTDFSVGQQNFRDVAETNDSPPHNPKKPEWVALESDLCDLLGAQVACKRQDPFGTNPIAIIGIQALFPQSNNTNEFWQHLAAGHDLITEVPIERWDWRKYYGDAKQDTTKTNSKWGGFLTDIDKFDAAFFNISPREADLMDPQHRLFMQIVWQTIEDAGYDPLAFSGRDVGLFVGAEFAEYQSVIATQANISHGYRATGNSYALLANRISYFFNWHAPSEVIHTACSSALVAICHAVQSLRQGECSVAVAGGVSLMLDPQTFVITSQLNVLSPDGRCKTFDQLANGYVKGEGIAAILLKPLAQAEKDGDFIYGVIKGAGVSHGGKAQSLTAPNAEAQSELLIKTWQQAEIDPHTITYIETHGTGTELGDPVEVQGLQQAFAKLSTDEDQLTVNQPYCGLGSVKTNIGHLEPASGMASVIKVLLSMRHEKIPANLHFNALNPYIDLAQTPFYIIHQLQTWQRLKDSKGNEIPRRAGVSSFGFGGSIAHLLLEESPSEALFTASDDIKPYYLIALSAKHEESLKQKIIQLHDWLQPQLQSIHLADLSFTLNTARSHFAIRRAFVVSSLSELCDALRDARDEKNTCDNDATDEYKNKLLQLANTYLENHPIDWHALYQGEKRQRIAALPGYPFLQTRHWVESEKLIAKNQNIPIPLQDAKLSNGSCRWKAPYAPNRSHKGLSSATRSAFRSRILSSERYISTASWQNLIFNYLQKIFAEKIKLAPTQIAMDETYEVYGVDSLLSLEIIQRLEQDLGTLPKTLLYEKNNLRELTEYLQTNCSEQLTTLFQDIAETGTNSNASPPHNPKKPEWVALESDLCDLLGAQVACKRQDPFGTNPIAIVGLTGTYPLAKNLDEFWLNLIEERDCITEIPPERWNYKDYPILLNGKEVYYKYGGFIADIDKFDPLFFNISPREAALMDPQERLFLQSAWSTMEDAGYTREKIKQNANHQVGVFVGVTYNFYPLFIAEEWAKGNRMPLDIQSFSIANRVSYFLNLSGPSYVVDTACSSSLAAIHLACESIAREECTMAIAGGVNLSLHPCKYHFLGSYGFMSLQGQCASFAKGGSGYVPAEGVGSVLLKPLGLALKDNDHIYAVIKGSSMNHGGKTSGYTVPNPNAQAELIKNALTRADVDARTISYIEAHGTGTALGDPIEIRGLQQAFETYTENKQFCAIGSVKSNMGHLEAAAGISQLTKVLLQLKHKKLVPSLHASELNPYIDFSTTPFFVQRELSDWPEHENYPRRAGISSFGAGGTNVHIVIEEFQTKTSADFLPATPPESFLFILSAANQEQLHQHAKNLHAFLVAEVKKYTTESQLNGWLQRVCYTLQTGRESMTARLAMVALDFNDLIDKLAAYIKLPEQPVQQLWSNCLEQAHKLTELPDEELAVLVQKNRGGELAEWWCKGVKVSWEQIYPNQTLKRISLPTYPFAKRRCWVNETSSQQLEHCEQVAAEVSKQWDTEQIITLRDWLYSVRWEQKPIASVSTTQPGNELSQWLIFSDKQSAEFFQYEFPKKNNIYCFSGDEFQRIDDRSFYLNPNHSADYGKLFSALFPTQNASLTGIIYSANFVSQFEFMSAENLWLESDAAETSHCLLYFFQALLKHKPKDKLPICFITRSSQIVTADTSIPTTPQDAKLSNGSCRLQAPYAPNRSHKGLSSATRSALRSRILMSDGDIQLWQHHLWSMLRIFAAEQPECQVLLIDLDSNPTAEDAKMIAHEIQVFDFTENHIAYRNRERYVMRLSTYLTDNDTIESVNWTPAKAVLITGGLGSLGIEVAKWLVGEGVNYLLLTGTTKLPAENEWSTIQDVSLKEKIAAMRFFAEKDINAIYVAVDVTNKRQMQAAIDEAQRTWQCQIQGVFHLAGIATDSMPISSSDPDGVFQRVLAVKIKGALVLHDLFKRTDLHCFVLFSSIAALPYFGMRGLCAYACANSFLNGLAAFRQQQGLKAISINWSAFADKGMSFNYQHSAFLAAVGMSELSPVLGIKILKYLLTLQAESVTVTKLDWRKFFQVNTDARKLAFFANFFSLQPVVDKTTTTINLLPEQINQVVIDTLAKSLGLNSTEIDSDLPLQHYGLDSITGIHFIAALAIFFPEMVSPMDLYRYPTIRRLVEYLIQICQPTQHKLAVQAVQPPDLLNQDELLDQVLNLSDEKINQMIAEEIMEIEHS